MTPTEILSAIGDNKAVLDTLPDDLRDAVLAAKKEKEESDRLVAEARAKAISAEQKKNDELARNRREEKEAERKELLCIGTWAENIPRNRRFALCVRDWKRYSEYLNDGWIYYKPHELVNCVELCAVDIVRGYTSPYFGYYCGDGVKQFQLKSWWKQRLQPVIEAETEDKFLTRIRCDWNFFKIYRAGAAEFPFRILTYRVDEKGTVTITGDSKPKTWQEHRADLEQEFAKGDCACGRAS